jgi:hypothetical protein
VNSTTQARGRPTRRRLSILAALLVLLTLVVGAASQSPALATVTVNAFAGTGTAGSSGDGGAATSAQLNQPQGVATDAAGNVFIFDNLNKEIREVDSSGNISTRLGTGSACSATGLTASLGPDNPGICSSSYPVGFGMSPDGNLFFGNGSSNGWLDDWKAHVAGKVTGTYSPGDTTGTNDAYSVSVAPGSLASPSDNGVYFAGASTAGWPGNSIKLVTSPGTSYSTVKTVAGMSGTSTCNYYPSNGDTAVGACIHPQYLTIWSHYLYFFDNSPGWKGPEIFRIDLNASSPTLQKIAGSGGSSDSPVGYLAVNSGISHVGPIAVSSTGEVYYGSISAGGIRKVDTSGYLRAVTDVGAAQSAMAFDSADNLYDALPYSNKVVKVTGLGSSTNHGHLVALGDSVPAGEGINYGFMWNGSGWVKTGPTNPSWADTTTALGGNFQDCHQSGYSYVNYFSSAYTVYDMACTSASVLQESGVPGGDNATTSGGVMVQQTFGNTAAPVPNQIVPAQLGSSDTPRCTGCDAANSQFDTNLGSSGVVLLQTGADDIDFSDWLSRCYSSTTDTCSLANPDQTTLDGMLTKEATDLRTTLTELNRRALSDGYSSSNKLKVVVQGYYNPYGGSWNSSCIDVGNGNSWPAIDKAEWDFVTHGLSELNTNISGEVTYAQSNDNNLNPVFVDLSSVMSGHEFCTGDPWVYGPSIDYPHLGNPALPKYPASFHPTPAGQYAIYQAVKQQAGL